MASLLVGGAIESMCAECGSGSIGEWDGLGQTCEPSQWKLWQLAGGGLDRDGSLKVYQAEWKTSAPGPLRPTLERRAGVGRLVHCFLQETPNVSPMSILIN